jgi:hypothetical protein
MRDMQPPQSITGWPFVGLIRGGAAVRQPVSTVDFSPI